MGESLNFRRLDGSDPVKFVSWFDAMAYCEWLSKRLECNFYLPSPKELVELYRMLPTVDWKTLEWTRESPEGLDIKQCYEEAEMFRSYEQMVIAGPQLMSEYKKFGITKSIAAVKFQSSSELSFRVIKSSFLL